MDIYIDSASLSEIWNAYSDGLIKGVTTNPSLLIANNFTEVSFAEKVSELVHGIPISIQVPYTDVTTMVTQATRLHSISKDIVIKLPCNKEGFCVSKILSERCIKTNMTLCFSAEQAIMAAASGAYYVSPFIGRLDDIGLDGVGLIRSIKNIYQGSKTISTKIICASIRSIDHIVKVAEIGADISTMNMALLLKMMSHELTVHGLKKFSGDCF